MALIFFQLQLETPNNDLKNAWVFELLRPN